MKRPFDVSAAAASAGAARVGAGRHSGAACASGAGVVSAGAAHVARADAVLVAQRLREERQAEELVADRAGKFLAGRRFAVAVAGNQHFNLGQHLEHDGDADLQREDVVAQVCTGYADGRDHRLDVVGDNGFVGDGEHHIAIHRDYTAADVLAAVCVGKEDVDGQIDLTAHAGEAGTVAQALDGEIAQHALGRRGAAALEGDGHDGLGAGLRGGVAGVGGRHQTVADERHTLVCQLRLIHTTVIDALYLNADPFVQTVEHLVSGDAARTMRRVCVLVGIKAHGARLLGLSRYEGDSS